MTRNNDRVVYCLLQGKKVPTKEEDTQIGCDAILPDKAAIFAASQFQTKFN